MVYAFGLVFMYAEFGNQISSQFDKIFDGFFEFDWYTFPLEIQQLMSTIIITAQKPMELRALGGTPSSRMTFKAVIFI